VTARLAPAQLADLHAFHERIPAHGRAEGIVHASGFRDGVGIRTPGLTLATDSSTLRVRGGARRDGATWAFDSVTLDLEPLRPGDWHAWLGSAAPVDAPITGRLVAHGSGRSGIRVDGSIDADDPAGARLTGAVAGTLWLEPDLRLDLAVESRGFRHARTGPLDLDVRLRGRTDSLAVTGSARLERSDSVHPLLRDLPSSAAERLEGARLTVDGVVRETGDSRRVTGHSQLIDRAGQVWLDLRGSAPLGDSGALHLTLVADSLPLALLPPIERVENLEGFVRARASARGTIEAPHLEADIRLLGARFDVPEYGTGVDSLRTHVRLAGQRIDLLDVRAFRGGGSLALDGGLDLAAPLDLRDPAASLDGATLAVHALLDTMTIVDMDSARAVVTGRATISGPLRHPHVAGAIDVVDGFVYEGRLAPNPPLDPADPPYVDLVRDAPWMAGRLSTAAAAEVDDARSAPALTADVRATVHPSFRIIDEDSDLGASGSVHVVIDERGSRALGDARIVDGFYAYYGELFQLAGGAFSVDGSATELAMSGVLRNADRPLGLNQGGHDGLDRRDPPVGIFGYSTRATVLELLRRRTALPASQPELASLLLFDVPVQPVDTWDHELMWRGDEPDDLVGHRSAIQGSGLAWSYLADDLYDYVPLARGYLRAGTIRIGSRYPGWIMLGTHLEAGVHAGPRLTARASHVVGGQTWPGVGLRYALRDESLQPADRHVELFNEPRFAMTDGTAGRREDVDVRRRTGLRLRWLWNY
jgi:hypothetical protein